MSRPSQQRTMQQQPKPPKQHLTEQEAIAASELFDLFCVATTMRQILGLHRDMCDILGLRPAPINEFYPMLKAKIRSWKAQALWKKFDARAAHRVYAKGTACNGTRVLVIGAGPCGMRAAIEAQLLGAKVVVLEKRDRITRNNVLHLWPFVITDLRNLGAKKFYGKFCAGSIDHISIRQLQIILMKVALLLGVEIHENVSFERTIEPSGEGFGWRAAVTPTDHVVSYYEFDVLIGADGKRNTLEGFKRKEFRGKLAIAITANFINKKTEAEAKAEEISGVAFIFNQSFFKELYEKTGIDLENIVYYKDETHYFVMTAKKHSLIDKGVILQDFSDPAELLAPANVSADKLLDYAREAAEFSTKYQMPNLEFAVNHYGKPDVAMFDFTSMFASETSCRVIVRKGFRLLQCLVGDSLLEPFWPTGSGCARGFLSSMDAAYATKLWSNTRNSILAVVAQRESIYRLLNQTTPENLQRDTGSYTVDPASRYPNLNRTAVSPFQVRTLVDSDDPKVLEQPNAEIITTPAEAPVAVRKRRSADIVPETLLYWVRTQLHMYDFIKDLQEPADILKTGKSLCALICRFRPDLIDYTTTHGLTPAERNEVAFKILETEYQLPRIMTGGKSIDLEKVDTRHWLHYLSQVREVFRGEVPYLKHPKMDVTELREKYRLNNAHAQPDFSKLLQLSTKPKYPKAKSPVGDMVDVPQVVYRRSVMEEDRVKRIRRHEPNTGSPATGGNGPQQGQTDTPRRAKKRRSAEKAANIDRNRGDIPSAMPRNNPDEQFSDRIKSMEQRISSRNASGSDKKPKDLMRAIGKIDSSDWNVREIEKKIEQSKRTETQGPKGREKVPKWSKEQFLARQNKMAKPTRQESVEEKFKEIDQTLKNLDKQLKEGSILEVGERGRNKVASIAGQFAKKDDKSVEEKNPLPTTTTITNTTTTGNVVPKSSAKVALAFKKQAASEKCHFCKQIVYLMEKITAEDLVFHRSCLKCHHCHTNLRLGGYAFDRDDPNGRFYCTQHFRLPAKAIRPVMRKPGQRKPTQQQQAAAAAAAATAAADNNIAKDLPIGSTPPDMLKTPDKLRGPADSVVQLDLLDRGQTPERIEFENTDAMSDGEPSEEHILDEHEWSGRNFLPESNQDSESDLSSSDDSDNDSDADMFEEANDSPLGAQTLQLATDWIGKQHYSDSDDSDDFYDTSEGIADDDDGKDDTDGEDFKKARELRREEVRLLPLPANLPTDTETEIKPLNENNENGDVEIVKEIDLSVEKTPSSHTLEPGSYKKSNSGNPFKTAVSSIGDVISAAKAAFLTPPPKKTDIEKLEQTTGQRFSAEIEAINEKLHRLNSVVKMNKDLEAIAKENLVKSDILKKLTMKEKWLADNSNNNSNTQTLAPKSSFENCLGTKPDILKQPQNNVNGIKKTETVLENLKSELNCKNKKDENNTEQKITSPEEILESLKAEIKSANLNRADKIERQQHISATAANADVNKKSSANNSRSNSFKNTNPSSNTKETPKSANTSRTNSLKRSEKFISKDEAISNDSRMQIQNILGLVKNVDNKKKPELQKDKSIDGNQSKSDIGKLLYDAENKFSPKPNKRLMQEKLKEIEARSFSGTMDAIKSQMVVPTVNSQTNLSADILKYFPDQKQQKSNTPAVNKNQKNLKDVDLGKYFPTSPTPQRRSAVVTVADKLKKSQTEKLIAVESKVPTDSTDKNAKPKKNNIAPKRQASLGNAPFSLRDHQLDGAVDLSKKKPEIATTTAATATVTKKGNVKIIKKIVPKKKVGAPTGTTKKTNSGQEIKSIVPRDDADIVLDEILQTTDKEMHSPSSEYLQLFKEEKSPSEDLSDKVERIYQETGIDLGLPQRSSSDNKKKLIKTKSLGEGEFDNHLKKKNSAIKEQQTKEEGDRPIGVQGLLARYESLSSMHPSEQSIKLRRMESNTSNLNGSKESLISRDSIISRESDTMSDLEKTMEYLKSEWRNEATNFLQKKRDKFYAQKHANEKEEDETSKADSLKKPKYEDLPVEYRESKIAKFFGIKSKSPEKREITTKRKSPEKKSLTSTTTKKITPSAIIKKSPSPVKELSKKANEAKVEEIKGKSSSPVKNGNKSTEILIKNVKQQIPKKSISPPKHLMENFEIDLLVEKGSMAAEADKLSKEKVQNGIENKVEINKEDTNIKQITPTKLREPNLEAKNVGTVQTTPTEIMSQHDPTSSELEAQTMTGHLDAKVNIEIAKIMPSITLPQQNSNNIDLQTEESPILKRRPIVEDIKNLPKSGCDKSLNSSRRNSQASLNTSRRCSDASLQDQLTASAVVNVDAAANENSNNVDELFENLVDTIEDKNSERNFGAEEDCDSLRISLSQSPSVVQTTARPRGSSEDESIEKLFSQFSDEMLVNVEFDSNDELIAITPRLPLNGENSADEDDFIERMESLEKDEIDTKELIKDQLDPEEGKHLELEKVKETEVPQNGPLQSSTASTEPLTLERIQAMLYIDPQEVSFPIKPQRKQKSRSSSSESSAPIAPQRMKHKLAKLCPDNMPPSVQDLMQTAFTKSLTAELAEKDRATLHKFPRNISEDELDDIKANESMECVKNKNMNQNASNAERTSIDRQTNPASFNGNMQQRETLKPTSVTLERTNPLSIPSVNQTFAPTANKSSNDAKIDSNLEVNSTASQARKLSKASICTVDNAGGKSSAGKTNSLSPSPVARRKPSISSINEKVMRAQDTSNTELLNNQDIGTPKGSPLLDKKSSPVAQKKFSPIINAAAANSPLIQWRLSQTLSAAEVLEKQGSGSTNAETQNYANSSKSNSSKESLNETNNVTTPNKATSKERSLEWDMTKMPSSPMPRRKFVHAERGGFENVKIKDVSPTSSIKILNNLSSNNSDSEEQRLIEDFEMERRQALIQRDKHYQEIEKKEKEKINQELEKKEKCVNALNEKKVEETNISSGSSSKRNTPLMTPLSSRRGTQDSISTQREPTPPNFKKLIIPPETEDTSLSSRCSSFAFIELMSNGEAREAPMPQKLKIPTKPKPITAVPIIDGPIPEVFQNRPWPKGELSPEIDTSESPDTVIEVKRANSEPKSPTPEVFHNRKWPDGKTTFEKSEEPHNAYDTDDGEFIRGNPKNRHKFKKLQSYSPQPTRRRKLTNDDTFKDTKSISKSIIDINRESPNTSIYNSEASINRGVRSSRSSGENSSPHMSSINATPKRPMRQTPVGPAPETIDANTRMLLNRSKNLHKRKNEFINERAAERNPYIRDVVKAEHITEYDAIESSGDELDCYRPGGYKAKQPLTRFPTSRTAGRDFYNNHYNYTTPTYGIDDYGLNSRRLYGTTTLPTGISSLDYNPYLSTGLSSSSIGGRRMHFNDYMRHSPSRHRDYREHSKESCVIT